MATTNPRHLSVEHFVRITMTDGQRIEGVLLANDTLEQVLHLEVADSAFETVPYDAFKSGTVSINKAYMEDDKVRYYRT